MSSFTGMDAAEVRNVGQQLGVAGQKLLDVATAVDHLVSIVGTPGWEGPDAVQFLGWWQQQHRPALVAGAEAVEGLGRSAANNAAEQEQISDGAGLAGVPGHVAAAAAAGAAAKLIPKAGVPEGSPAPGATVAPAIAGRTQSFVAEWDGKYMDYDKAYGNQCFDVFSQYNHEVVGGPDIHAATTGGAKDLFNDYSSNGVATHYDRIPTGGGQPQVGDVVVWGNGQYGHVGIVTSVNENGFTSLEQNTDGRASSTTTGALSHQVAHQFSSSQPLGYLRPKS